jgi:SET domain
MHSPTCFSFLLFFWMLTILLVLCTATTTANSSSSSSSSGSQTKEEDNKDKTESNDEDGYRQLVAWVKQHGGRVADDMFQLQQIMNDDDDDDGVAMRGGVATANIAKGTELLFCPWDLVLGSTSLQRDHHKMLSEDDMCSVIESIDEELRLGHDSQWYWYLKLHQDDIVNNNTLSSRLTTFWNQASLEQLQGLPPQDDGNRHLRKTQQECGEQQQLFLSKTMKQALVLYLTRSTAIGMIPIYDLFNHHNGYRNAKMELLKAKNNSSNDGGTTHDGGGGIQLIATQDITVGSQIYLSYGIKASSSMFRDYGFVESWPQVWVWTDTYRQHTLITLLDVAVIYPTNDFFEGIRQRTKSTNTDADSTNVGKNNMNMSSSSSSSSSSVLSAFQQLGMQHSRNLPREDFIIFAASARNLLNSLPTTVQDDFGILAEMKRELQLAQQNNANVNNNKKSSPRQVAMIQEQADSISAVEYRIKFKQAVQIGLNTARRLLLQHDGQQTSTAGTHNSEL